MTTEGAWLGRKGTSLSTVGEFGLIDRLKLIVERETRARGLSSERLAIGIGDDAAAYRPDPDCEILVTCDIQVSGRHFVPSWISPRALGGRCIAVNVSDIGAMGGMPRAALVSLGLGPEIAVEDIEALYEGMMDRLLPLGTLLAGGNVSSLESGLIIDVTVIGEVEKGRAIRRDTARAGDIIWVTGYPGSAAAGLAILEARGGRPETGAIASLVEAYLQPAARPVEGRALGRSGAVTAMIDLSDGLIGDLRHMVEGPGIGALLRAESLPRSEPLREAAAILGRSAESLLFSPSDDYELLFTTRPEAAERAIGALREASTVPVWPIGEIIAEASGRILLEARDGSRREAQASGWDHFAG
ncbi:MAG: thiamine-phosphate kinase [Candidatus Eisenbacteria bacterium]|nr:thiamine-phosphate kinase [Candidatus Eisenbacteria bacterium]